MPILTFLQAIAILMLAGSVVSAEDGARGRIKRKPPSELEAQRIASDMAMNDNLLRKGDIVATDRGFFIYRGLAPDGFTNDFAPVSNPLPATKK
jgi:hypothetical protein